MNLPDGTFRLMMSSDQMISCISPHMVWFKAGWKPVKFPFKFNLHMDEAFAALRLTRWRLRALTQSVLYLLNHSRHHTYGGPVWSDPPLVWISVWSSPQVSLSVPGLPVLGKGESYSCFFQDSHSPAVVTESGVSCHSPHSSRVPAVPPGQGECIVTPRPDCLLFLVQSCWGWSLIMALNFSTLGLQDLAPVMRLIFLHVCFCMCVLAWQMWHTRIQFSPYVHGCRLT